jgi:glutamate/tyrosine decarboxylase-like PLP-dependent enzyme
VTTVEEPRSARAPAPVRDLAGSADDARAWGADVVALWSEVLERLPELPVARRLTPEAVRAGLAIPVPDEPMPRERVLEHLRTLAFEYATYIPHAGFVAYITGPGTIPAAAADLLAAGLNQNTGGWRLGPGATEIELHLTRWFGERLGMPPPAGGIITSGGAMSAFIGLKAALHAKAGWDVRTRGVAAGPPVALYASSEVHTVNVRAADMMGLGAAAVRSIPVDPALRIRTDLLRQAVAADLRAGTRPIAVIGSAGTVATGAVDPLDELADVAAEHGLWFHVDGAYGGVAAMTDELRPLFHGIERADSVVLDPHKWLYTPQSGGALVVRDLERLRDAFSVEPSYTHEDKTVTGRGPDLYEVGPNFSRGFHALKIWVSLLAYGWRAYQRRIAHDVRLARYLHERVLESPELEPVGPVPVLSIACFRYVPADLAGDAGADAYLNRLNEALMLELQLDGRVFPSNAVVGGRYAIRACLVNVRTEAADVDALLDAAVRHGRRLDASLRPGRART